MDTARPTDRIANLRDSVTSRVSRLFDRRNDQESSFSRSHRTSGACEVPIFMSPSSERIHLDQDGQGAARTISTMRQDFNNAPASDVTHSSVYSQSPDPRHQDGFVDHIEEDHRPESSDTIPDLEAGLSTGSFTSSEAYLVREKRRKRRRVSESDREKIASKKRIGMAFGVTTLAAVITYTVLAVTGTAQGVMFHVLAIVFVLALMGVFLHSAIRLVMLQRRRRARLARQRNWHGSHGRSRTLGSTRNCSASSTDPFADPISEKSIPVVVGGDEIVTTTPRGKNKRVIRPPPPVYGNFRESKRIQPEMLFSRSHNPSPTTPTYEEALQDVQTAVGYQPPQYVSPRSHRQAIETGQRISNIHPLERERLVGLMGNTMSSQR